MRSLLLNSEARTLPCRGRTVPDARELGAPGHDGGSAGADAGPHHPRSLTHGCQVLRIQVRGPALSLEQACSSSAAGLSTLSWGCRQRSAPHRHPAYSACSCQASRQCRQAVLSPFSAGRLQRLCKPTKCSLRLDTSIVRAAIPSIAWLHSAVSSCSLLAVTGCWPACSQARPANQDVHHS